MQTKKIHLSQGVVWLYHVGRSHVRITNPERKSWAVRKSDLFKDNDEGFVPSHCVRNYIRRHLLYYHKRIIPERGALVLLKRALLKL